MSYVLNNTPGRSIPKSTRDHVLAVAERLGHVPYAPARSLRLGRSDIVLALVGDFTLGHVSNRMLHELDIALSERGYGLLAHRFDPKARRPNDIWRLVSPTLVVAMGSLALPGAFSLNDESIKLMRVAGMVAHSRSGEMQVNHLYERGHRRIAYAYPRKPTVESVAKGRLRGSRNACKRLGIPSPPVTYVDVDDPTSVFRAVDDWLNSDPKITAICAHNDEIALLIISALAVRGFSPATGLAVIGIDDIPMARIALSTIGIDVDQWSAAVVNRVLHLLDGTESVEAPRELLHLIVRNSTPEYAP